MGIAAGRRRIGKLVLTGHAEKYRERRRGRRIRGEGNEGSLPNRPLLSKTEKDTAAICALIPDGQHPIKIVDKIESRIHKRPLRRSGTQAGHFRFH